MAPALGRGFTDREVIDRRFEDLWKTDRSKLERQRELWKEIGTDKAAADPQARLLQLCDFLLRRVEAEPMKIGDAAGLLNLEPGRPRPAEAHLLMMIDDFHRRNNKFTLPPANHLTRALQVRRLAEEVALSATGPRLHAYSEHLSQELRRRIEQADVRRRRGEDLL